VPNDHDESLTPPWCARPSRAFARCPSLSATRMFATRQPSRLGSPTAIRRPTTLRTSGFAPMGLTNWPPTSGDQSRDYFFTRVLFHLTASGEAISQCTAFRSRAGEVRLASSSPSPAPRLCLMVGGRGPWRRRVRVRVVALDGVPAQRQNLFPPRTAMEASRAKAWSAQSLAVCCDTALRTL